VTRERTYIRLSLAVYGMDTPSRALVSESWLGTDRPIRLGGSLLGAARHVCASFESGGETICVGIMRTDPTIIVGGILQENPFLVPPARFLRELREGRRT